MKDPHTRALLRTVFDPEWYLTQCPELRSDPGDPFDHFITRGLQEGRDPGRWFDSAWYLAAYRDVGLNRLVPLTHFLEHGIAEGRFPSAAWASLGCWPDGLSPTMENLPAAVRAAERNATSRWTIDPGREDPLPECAAAWASSLARCLRD